MDLPRRRDEQVRAVHHMGDALFGIIHHDGELISAAAVGPPDDEIADTEGQSLAMAALQAIVETDSRFADPHPPGARGSAPQAPAASARINRALVALERGVG